MSLLPDRFCARECVKDGEVHNFKGRVKLVIVEPSKSDQRWRNMVAAFIAVSNLMIGGNFGIIFIFSMSYTLPMLSSLHVLLTCLGIQFCLPLSILMLHPLNGASASIREEQRRHEHIVMSVISFGLLVSGCFVLIFLKTKNCFNQIHAYGGYVTIATTVLSVFTGLLIFATKKERESPNILTKLHRFCGMLTLILSTLTFMTSLYGSGGCRDTFRLWLYSIGFYAPLYVIYFMAIFYTLVVLLVPGSKFVPKTSYHC